MLWCAMRLAGTEQHRLDGWGAAWDAEGCGMWDFTGC